MTIVIKKIGVPQESTIEPLLLHMNITGNDLKFAQQKLFTHTFSVIWKTI